MKKSLILSVICSSFVLGGGFVHPLPNGYRSIENGGTLSAIDAYQDGVGAMVVQNGRAIDNSSMNKLVFKYGNVAKENGIIVGDQVLLSGSPEDKLLAGKLFADGAICNDGNPLSIGEIYLNGICQGGLIPNGTSCSDNNVMTVNDIYINQICRGTLTVNGQTCNDGNIMTVDDVYTNGVCAGTLTVNGQNCSDNNVMTINDTYTNGICSGTMTTNGQICTDNNVMTINDIYTNGICAGKLTVNPTCSDGTMTWNTTTKLCSKGATSTYVASNSLAGYTISGNSTGSYGCGLIKNGNSFYASCNGANGASVYIKPNGALSGNSLAGYFTLYATSTGFYYNLGQVGIGINYGAGTNITVNATTLSQDSTVLYNSNPFGLIKNASGFYAKYVTLGATINFVPFYSGYTCPSGGTLSDSTCTINTLVTASGVCQTGYTLNTTLGKCVEN